MFHRFRWLPVIAGLFLFISGDLFAQTTRELGFDAWVPGKIRAGNEYWFSIKAPDTGFVVVETSGDTDTYLAAYDASNTFIDEDDDSGSAYNARLRISVEGGKTYLFRLKGYDEDESGPYQIRASFKTNLELQLGAAISGTLDDGEEQWFSVRATDTGFIVVETSGNIDTYLRAYSGTGTTAIAEDDDGGEGYNARVEIFVNAGEMYRFKLSHFEDEESPYQIQARFEPLPPDTDQNTERLRAIPLKLGEPNPVYLRSPSESRWYRYDILRDGTLFVVQTRGNLDTELTLYDADGNFIERNDDSGEGDNAFISRKLGIGTVYIEVQEYDGNTGRCTLHAEIR